MNPILPSRQRTPVSQPAATFTLTGWKAVAAIVVVAGFIGFRTVSARATLDTQGRAVLERYVAIRLQAGVLAAGPAAPVPTEEEARALLQAGDVHIRSMRARGSGSRLVVRIELEPNPAFPVGTERVRYYRLTHSALTGWQVQAEVTRWSYWAALL